MMLVQPGRSNVMTVVAIVNQKGGVGKTTLAWSLARTGIMLLVNAGPQGSARDWNHFNITGPDGLFVQSHPT
jgi:cellulose biosynthesis protein BcsQ